MSVTGSIPHACCTLPPVQAEYTPKGTYSDVATFKSYITGPADASKAIVVVYDIFGFTPQVLQGADLLASQGVRVIIPDFLQGSYANPAWFDGSEEGNKKRAEYFQTVPGSVVSRTGPFADVVKAVKALPGIQKIGGLGYCWGWKVVVTSQGAELLDAAAGMHPTFLANEDGDKLKGPLCLLPSGDEDMSIINDLMEKAEAKTPGENVMKHYPNESHGFLGARADLSGNEHTKAYHDAYTQASRFFNAALA